MSGTINLAFTQQFDAQGDPLSGGLLYFFTAGTTAPQSAFQDTALTIAHPNPIVLDASGRVPMFYIADGFIKIRLTDKTGVVIIAADQLLVIGPSGGTGGGTSGGTADATAVLTTGDIKARYGTGVRDGFVRCNGNTIGGAGSSATERAADICRPLYEYLYVLPNIPADVGQTKTGNAATDFGAGIRLVLPDLRGRTIAGLDDMGAAASNRLGGLGLGAGINGTTLGNAGGAQTATLTTTELPAHTHTQQGTHTSGQPSADHTHTQKGTFTSGTESQDHTHSYTAPQASAGASGGLLVSQTTSATSGGASVQHTHDVIISGQTDGVSAGHTHSTTLAGATTSTGSGAAFSKTPPTMIMTFYMKM